MPGYSKEMLVTEPDKKYLCVKCHLILRDPVQTDCGHRYCQSCIEEILCSPCPHICLACDEECMEQVYPDNAMKREILGSQRVCRINELGCQWQGLLRDYEQHTLECPHDDQVVNCTKRCGQRMQSGKLINHLTTHCPRRVVMCDHCKEKVVWKDLQTHHGDCPKFMTSCKFCDKNMLREKLEEHLDAEKGDCQKKHHYQQYQRDGSGHYMVNTEENYRDLRISYNTFSLALLRISMIIRCIQGPLISMVGNIIAELQRMLPMVNRSQQTLVEKIIQDLGKCTNDLTANGSRIERMLVRIAYQMEAYSSIIKSGGGRDTKRQIVQLQKAVTAKDRIIALKDIALAEQDLRIQSLEMASYDGVLVWKISDFHQKRQDAMSERNASIYSPCFYTSHHGYKMCAQIYLNGDGMGKGNHVSLFFVIMKGEYDANLKWPFKQKVTFMLLDQNNREHVIDAFRPDPTSSSFKRPTNDMNIASGCPLFMPISQLDSSRHAYVKEHVMFVKVIVDTSDIPQ